LCLATCEIHRKGARNSWQKNLILLEPKKPNPTQPNPKHPPQPTATQPDPINEQRDARITAHLTAQPTAQQATGEAYCGIVGLSKERREYTVMGQVANLAARLMSCAGKNGILIDGETVSGILGCFILIAPI
jgi:hypothetical protein